MVRRDSAFLAYLGAAIISDLCLGPDPLAGIDIEREYELIKQKKSSLSRAKRELVVRRYLRQQQMPGRRNLAD